MFDAYLEPEMSSRLTGEVCEKVLERSCDAVERLQGRNEDFHTWDMQAERDPWWSGTRPRWKDGCYVEDPLTDENIYEKVAEQYYIRQQSETFQTSEIDEDDAQDAADIEAFLNDVCIESRFNTVHTYNLLEYGARHSYGVLYAGWKQSYQQMYKPVMRHKSGRVFDREDPFVQKNDASDFDLIEEQTEEVLYEGLDLRVPYTGDVYLDPVGSQAFRNPDGTNACARVIERFFYTEDDLLNGIDDFEYDEDRVKQMLKTGPTSVSSDSAFSEYNDRDGISDAERDVWEVYMVVGTAPAMLTDGNSGLKASERRRDYVWMLCPERRICFKFSKSPFHSRPYVKFPFRTIPNRMVGHSVCNMLAPLQREASSAFRFRIDFRDLYMSSPLIVPAPLYNDWGSFRSYPGAMYPIEAPYTADMVKPMPYDARGYQAANEDWKETLSRAGQYFSSDAKGGPATPGVSATQSMQAGMGADEKSDLLIANFNFGIEEFGAVILSHYRQFTSSEGLSRKIGQKSVKISPEMLRKQFRISATGSSESANPAIKIAKAMQVLKVAQSDPILQQKFAQGDQTGLYFVLSHVYRALGIRNPQSINGREPTVPPNEGYILQAVMQMLMQYAQQGDPAALQAIQLIRQLSASGQQGQQGQQPHGGQSQAMQKVSESINFKDLAPNQQDQLAQMVGLPAGQWGGSVSKGGHQRVALNGQQSQQGQPQQPMNGVR